MASKPVYRKRVIQAGSSSEEDDTDSQPLAKRSKPAEDPTPSGWAPAPPASSPAVPAATSVATDSKLAIFTTGSDDDDDAGDPASSEEDEKPLAASAAVKAASNGTNGKDLKPDVAKDEVKMEVDGDESSEDEKPLASVKPLAPLKKSKKVAASKNAKASSSKPAKVKREASTEESEHEEEDDASDESDDKPLASKIKAVSTKKAAAPKKAAPIKKTTAAKVKEPLSVAGSSPVKKGKGKGKAGKEEDGEASGSNSEDEVYRWWDKDDDGVTKWKTLSHNGVLFPPEYEPHGVKMKYDGKAVSLSPEAEEVASFFAAILETDYPKNPVFVKNFFQSWTEVMERHPPTDGTKIMSFAKCDFTPIFAHLEAEKAKKKEMTAAQKKAAKAARDIVEEPYKTCLLDGRKEQVGNFRVEPPGLFRGRGEHPRTGLLKTRVRPEQITINIGKDEPIPSPPQGHRWKDVVHDDKVTWLATWKENINNAVKYVFLAAGSSLKGQSDFKKFEKARALKEHVDRIRADYTADLKSKEMAIRQRATAIYLIDRFALRNGNEKGEEEADTVGCCSLRFEHVTLEPPTWVTFDFLGKDSIRYTNRVSVDESVFKNLKIFKKEPKGVGDTLFDRLNTGLVNKYLTSYMEGLTAKVFRTYNASWTFVQQLKDTPKEGTVADKILAYNRANRLVAILCNHQKSVSKNHSVLMEKMADKTRALKYQRMKLRLALGAVADAKDKKKKYAELLEEESDLEDDWVVAHEDNLVVLEREKIRKKFDKESAKLAEAGEELLKPSELTERLKAADELEKSLKAERKKGYKESRLNEDRLAAAIQKLDERIQVQKMAVTDRDEGKEVSLGTSKINYLDPRITVAWAKKNDVPLTKLLSKTLLTKFTWALEVDEDFAW